MEPLLLSIPKRKALQGLRNAIINRFEFHELNVQDLISLAYVYNIQLKDWILVHNIYASTFAGLYERNVVKSLMALFKERKNQIFVDVGAYAGLYTIIAAKHDLQVLAYEPNPINFRLLIENIRLKCLERNVLPLNAAAGERIGKAILKCPLSPIESSLMNRMSNSLKLKEIVVNVMPIDEAIRRYKLGPVGIMKIDVEGAGFKVLQGAENTIRSYKPHIIFEVHATFGDDEVKAVKSMKKFDYELKIIAQRHQRNFSVLLTPVSKKEH
ncbi:MAG: FkbM family methyltransferase [Candidatus Bathyarchaeia archaeon]